MRMRRYNYADATRFTPDCYLAPMAMAMASAYRSRGVMSLVAIHWEEVKNLSFDMLGLCCHNIMVLAIRMFGPLGFEFALLTCK